MIVWLEHGRPSDELGLHLKPKWSKDVTAASLMGADKQVF